MKSKTPGKKRKAVVIAAPQADDDGEGSTSSSQKKWRSDRGKERTKINKLQLRDGVRRSR